MALDDSGRYPGGRNRLPRVCGLRKRFVGDFGTFGSWVFRGMIAKAHELTVEQYRCVIIS
jgi:hypothetical protein